MVASLSAETSQKRSPFFVILAVILLAVVFWGFAPTFFLRPISGRVDYVGNPSLPGYIFVHGLMLTAWYCLFVTQSCLVFTRRIDIHRQIGIAGTVLATTIVLYGAYITAKAVPRWSAHELESSLATPFNELEASVGFLALGNFAILLFFAAFVIAAVISRRNSATHKRFMLFASLWLMIPAGAPRPVGPGEPFTTGLPPFALFAIAVILSVAFYDWFRRRRILPATYIGFVAFIVFGVLMSVQSSIGIGVAIYRWLA